MKQIIKIIKKIILFVGIFSGVIIIAGLLFVNLSPQFRGKHSKEALLRYKTSKNYKEGKFLNLLPTKSTPSFSDIGKLLKVLTKSVPNGTPTDSIPVQKIAKDELKIVSEQAKFIWFGHSSILLEIAGKRILIDPMFGEVPSPISWMGSNRFSKTLPLSIEELPEIDIVLISHDHYDHLDYESIKALKSKVKKYITPLGVGSHLQAWDIDNSNITELDWWQETQIEGLTFAATPARHFSGRSLSDSKETLWASWVIQSEKENIYFSGDSGYGDHFKAIGEKYGPFDLAFMECGQYNDDLPEYPIHMYPEETAQASLDVKAKQVMPIHWAAFKLNQHPWKEPAERLTAKAKTLNINLVTPVIGETVYLDKLDEEHESWWRQVK